MKLDQLRDILTHTHSLSFIDKVKIIGENNETLIRAIDEDKAAVVYGKLKKPIDDFDGHTVGLGNMGILHGYCQFPLYQSDNASVTVETTTKKQQTVPCEIKFDSNDGYKASYRMMDETLANDVVKVPPFKGVPWDVTIEPTKESIAELRYFAGILSGQDPLYTVSMEGSTLKMTLGEGGDSKAAVPFAKDVTGTLKHEWSWPIAETLAILKLGDNAICTMSFSSHGAMKITIDSGIGEYEYILPARSR